MKTYSIWLITGGGMGSNFYKIHCKAEGEEGSHNHRRPELCTPGHWPPQSKDKFENTWLFSCNLLLLYVVSNQIILKKLYLLCDKNFLDNLRPCNLLDWLEVKFSHWALYEIYFTRNIGLQRLNTQYIAVIVLRTDCCSLKVSFLKAFVCRKKEKALAKSLTPWACRTASEDNIPIM